MARHYRAPVKVAEPVTRYLNKAQAAWLAAHQADFPDLTIDGRKVICQNQQVADRLEQALKDNKVGM